MSVEALTAFIAEYIAARRQTKLEAFDKKTAKSNADDNIDIAEKRREKELCYEPNTWLTAAANRAWQIFFPVTHAAKYTHGDSKSRSFHTITQVKEGYVNTSVLNSFETDTVGNAAVFDLAQFLQTVVEGDSLYACLKRGDSRPFAAFTDDVDQLNEWIIGFSLALEPGELKSHMLAKQNYFPVGDDYHLLSPLFATSLVHAYHQKMIAFRFGDEVNAIRKARREKTWHSQPLVLFPESAEMHFGGTKPQNISYLNSVRGGRVWLLSAQPPQWEFVFQPPVNIRSIFAIGGEFDLAARSTVRLMIAVIKRPGKDVTIRRDREQYVEELIDLLFMVSGKLQREEWQNWTLNCPTLAGHQQLWLDPWRTKTDEAFRQERDKDDWQKKVAEDFAVWLNVRLRKAFPDVGQVEKREWETRKHLHNQLRITEKMLREALK